MSSTRQAKDPSIFHQSRYASSSVYEQGLNASLVARRCSVLVDAADRRVIYWLHLLSHQSGGFNAVAEKLVAHYGDQLGTEQMARIGKRAGQKYNADEVKKIRQELPRDLSHRFPLRGETGWELGELLTPTGRFEDLTWSQRKLYVESDRAAQEREDALKNPTSYPVDDFLALCRDAALSPNELLNSREKLLADELRDLCLDPDRQLHSDLPWYFFNLDHTLRDYMRDWIAQKAAGVVVTALGKQVHEMLDYTLHSRSMTLLVGQARRGKSFTARSWCEQHPGQARFIEVPTGNDDTSFFRAFARGLGMGKFSQYKAIDLRERVESVLLTGDILVCLDEAQRLWPEANSRCGFPRRISWIMSMANEHVPFCLIATPQFFDRQNLSDQIAGWNSAQLVGRISDWKQLPEELEIQDLVAVAKAVLPEADKPTLVALADYADASERYLSAIDAIASRARYDAARAGRSQITSADVRKAMKQSVIPSDSLLKQTLEKFKKTHSKRRPILSGQSPITAPTPMPARMAGDTSETDETLTLDRRNGNPEGSLELVKD